jgi:hypothetical protein
VDDLILYLKDPKDSTKKLLDVIKMFSNIAGYNIQKSVAFLYAKYEQAEEEIRKTTTFTTASKN